MIRFLAAAFASLILLCGCANSVSTTAVTEDAHIIASGLQGALSNPQISTLFPPSSRPAINQALADLVVVSNAMATSQSAAAAKPAVVQIESDVNAIVNALAGLTLPSPAPEVLNAALALLPVIESAAGLPAPASAAVGHMSPDDARLVLAAAAR